MTGRTAAALATTQRAGNTSACFVNKLETNCSQFIPLYLLCTSILISVVLHGEDALKLALGKNVRSVQLASKSTNLRPGTQKTFGRKNTALRPSGKDDRNFGHSWRSTASKAWSAYHAFDQKRLEAAEGSANLVQIWKAGMLPVSMAGP